MQCYISESLAGLDFKKKYGFTDYTDKTKPVVIFGMYRDADFDVFLYHKAAMTIVWQGMDAKDIYDVWVDWFQNTKSDVKHIAISHWIKESLDSYGIESELIPVSATVNEVTVMPRGEFVYFYTPDFSQTSMNYSGGWMLEEIRERLSNHHIQLIVGRHGKYLKHSLYAIYRKCFLNLRLTEYDGCPNTNLEMGLMGRRSIFNGNIPHSIPWKNVEDIVENILIEYNNRHEDNTFIAQDIANFLNIEFP